LTVIKTVINDKVGDHVLFGSSRRPAGTDAPRAPNRRATVAPAWSHRSEKRPAFVQETQHRDLPSHQGASCPRRRSVRVSRA